MNNILQLHGLTRTSNFNPNSVYTRNPTFLPLPTLIATQQMLVGLCAIFTDNTAVAVQVNGNYTVNWGDGTSTNHWSGSQATKIYNFNSITSPVTDEGFKQCIITITPQAGQNLTLINLNQKHPNAAGTSAITSPWLDVAVSGPFLTTLHVGNGFIDINHLLLENFSLIKFAGNTLANAFRNCFALRNIDSLDTVNVRTFSSMFEQCRNLRKVPDINLSLATNLTKLFRNCFTLEIVGALNTSSCTNFIEMFDGCNQIKTIPAMNTALGTRFDSMFRGCSSLEKIGAMNVNASTNFNNMFSGCTMLEEMNFSNIGRDFQLSDLNLSKAEILKVINALKNNAGNRTLIIRNTRGAVTLTAAEKAIATNKGWTIAS